MESAKKVPESIDESKLTGPFSPVLEISCSKLVVISGQVGMDAQGNIMGDTIEEQTRCTLENCKAQLAAAGCTLEDVFKSNVYMADLKDWASFNQIYMEMIPRPRPVRTAVSAGLLPGLLVEVEMWAAKK